MKNLLFNDVICNSTFEKVFEEIIDESIESPRNREIFKMRFLEGKTLAEIAKVMEITENRVSQVANKTARKVARGLNRHCLKIERLEKAAEAKRDEEEATLHDETEAAINTVDTSIYIEDLPFISVRAVKILKNHRIYRVDELIENIDSIKRLYGMGVGTYRNICETLNLYLNVKAYDYNSFYDK